MSEPNEFLLFEQIKQGNIKAFENMFHKYYNYLCSYAEKFTGDAIVAEEIVQDFFVDFWEKKEVLNIDRSLKYYLFGSVRNRCFNHIQHEKTKTRYAQKIFDEQEKLNSDDDVFIEIDLVKKIEEGIQSLPEKRREIFRLSRQEGLKYAEIAKKLKISIKTVETHMGLAIKSLREILKKYNTLFLFFL